jgi:glycerol-3-phosphate dehydrogenase (NAD(P)+)
MKEVAEGVSTSKAAQALGKKYQVNMPVTDEVVKVLFERKTPNQSITDLMTRLPAQE